MTVASAARVGGDLLTDAEAPLASELPGSPALLQNYPNPFNPSTTITFALPEASAVRVEVYSILGQRVKTLVDGPLFSSMHTVRWDGRSETGLPVSSGTYIIRFEARPASGSASAPVVQTRRMMLLR
jgi:hypothetical protein